MFSCLRGPAWSAERCSRISKRRSNVSSAQKPCNRVRGRAVAVGSPCHVVGSAPAEVRRSGLLALSDDAEADGPGSREQSEQPVAVAASDHSLKSRQVLGKSAEHLQHRLLIVQEDITPHCRIGRSDSGEVAEAASREFHHFRAGYILKISRRPHDIVCDEMRNVARDSEDQIMVGSLHDLDVGADRLPERADLSPRRRRRRSSGGVKIDHRLTKRVAKPASGPDCSVPATG